MIRLRFKLVGLRRHEATYVESSIHCLSKPDVFAVLALA